MATTQTSINNTACSNLASRKIFRSYFNARWQNLQNFVNDSVFFSQIPARWLNYYNAYVRQWLQWSRGFVPQLHKQDFFSTGIGYTICDIFARECMSGGCRLDCKDDATAAFLEEWGDKRLIPLLNRMFVFANAGGNSLLVLTPVKGDIYPSVLPTDRFIFDIGRKGDISFALLYNRFSSGDDGYYALETRITTEGKSYFKVELQKGDGVILSPTFVKANNGLPNVPKEAQTQWEYNYGDIEPNLWYELPPAIGIGVFNVQNKAVAMSVADIEGYSDSTLHTALDILYSIDFNYTQGQLDMYWGKTRVLLPKTMQPRQVKEIGGREYIPSESTPIDTFDVTAALGDDIYAKVVDSNAVDGKPVQPEFIQPDLRGEAHKYIRDADLELLASKVGLSSSTLANHLTYNNPKTATQVMAEADTTTVSVNNKRSLAGIAINKLLRAVCAFYGLKGDDAHIVWNKYGTNSPQENSELLAEYTAGLLPKREFVRRRYPDLTDKQVEEWIAQLDAETPPMERDYNLGGF